MRSPRLPFLRTGMAPASAIPLLFREPHTPVEKRDETRRRTPEAVKAKKPHTEA